MLTISSGHSARYLTDAVAAGRENYYTGAVAEGEPPGRWYGDGAEQLGLRGLVDTQDMTALYERYLDPRDPMFKCPEAWDEASTLGHTGRRYPTEDEIYGRLLDAEPHADAERRDELRVEASTSVRRNVAFLDATFSVQKSVTIVHTAFEAQEVAARTAGRLDEAAVWAEARTAVEDAVWAGNNAMLDYLAEHAGFCRVGHHGGAAGRWADAHDWTIGSFFQHDSRDHDPQLHIHNAILNRVQGPDGDWRTLDGRSIYRWRPAAGAFAERVTEERLAHTLGLRFAMRPDGKAREVVGIPETVNELFSSRTRAITPKHAELVAAYEERYGHAPNRLETSRLGKRATFLTRQAKSHDGQPREAWLEEWDRRLRAEISGGLSQLADQVMDNAGTPPEPIRWSPVEVIETALAAVQAKKAAWTEPDLIREINTALPDYLGLPEGEKVADLLDRLGKEALALAVPLDAARPGEHVLPDELRRADGESVYQAPGARLYATPQHVATEQLLVAATTDQSATALDARAAEAFFEQLRGTGVELGADQAAAVRGVLTSGARVETLIGPAGTGKSFVVGTIAHAWHDGTGRVYGLATSQIAAQVLADEGLAAANTARWLATQARLADGRTREGDDAWTLSDRDLVVVDESSMADTAALAAVHARVEAAGAKLLLVGDHAQLSAVGAGGALELLTEHGRSYELAEARRFTHTWEREASLRLRAGDTTVIEAYHREGRIIDGGSVEQTETAAGHRWLAETLNGRHTLLVVDDNDQAARLNAALRAELVRLGRVSEEGVFLGREGTVAGVGDVVAARRLAWDLAGYQGNAAVPTTRQQYRVQQVRDDGSIVVTPILTPLASGAAEVLGEPMTLPASYVEQDLTLGYAATVHAAEGLTVDHGIEIVTTATRANALYPGATRGRECNTMFVVTQAAPTRDAESGEVAQAPRHDPRGILARILETNQIERAATTEACESAETMVQVRTAGELFADETARVVTARTAVMLDRLVDDGTLTGHQRARLAAEDAATSLGRILRRAELAGHEPEAVLRAAITEQEIDTARIISNVLRARITDRLHLDPRGERFADWVPATDNPDWDIYLTALAEHADARRAVLGDQAVADPPAWAVEALGPLPSDAAECEVWRDRAATVAAHRELTGHVEDATAIGAPPPPGQSEAYASWRAAWRALGRPDADRDEAEMSDGQLRMRVRAYERDQAWAPRHVANELAGTIQAAATHRDRATRWAAQAQATTDPAERDRLTRDATGAGALADALDNQIEILRDLNQQRALWFAHTAGTRAAADRAQAELTARHAGDETPDQKVTAEEWMAADREAALADDAHREITESDLADDMGEAVSLETPLDDLRQIAEIEPAQADEGAVRVPTAEETTAAISRARRALVEIRNRDAVDAAEETRNAQLTQWHQDDYAMADEQSPDVLERADYM